MKRILIAHQSTIPHYRVPFYNALERLRPSTWCFDVVFDPTKAKSFFKEQINKQLFEFPVLPVKTLSARIGAKAISYQTFLIKAANYDLVVVENAVNNLTYPCCQLHQLRGVKFAYWGHGKDRDVEQVSGLKYLAEKLKMALSRKADGFFAYTSGVKSYLINCGIPSQKIFNLNNTIDIEEQRRIFEKWYPRRVRIKEKLNIQGKKVILFVGRFTKNKKIDFLLESFFILRQKDSDFHLLLVGSGDNFYTSSQLDNITFLGTITEPDELGKIYVASDVFVFPGSVGLGPLQALCYNLPIITIASNTHMPEIEYVSPMNSIILNSSATPEEYSQTIIDLFCDSERLNTLRTDTWFSIKHLTIEKMARNFIAGVNNLLDL